MPERFKPLRHLLHPESVLREQVHANPHVFIDALTLQYGEFPSNLSEISRMYTRFDNLSKEKTFSYIEKTFAELYLELAKNEQMHTYHTKADTTKRDMSLFAFLQFRDRQEKIAKYTRRITKGLSFGITPDEGKMIVETLMPWRPPAPVPTVPALKR